MLQPVSVAVDVPRSREDVYAFLDVMANHEAFTDHMLVDWKLSGPPAGVGSKAGVTAKFGALSDQAEIEVFEVEPGRLIRERSVAAKGRRVSTGTYVLSDLPGGGTRVQFTFAFERVPRSERMLGPVLRAMIRRGNARAMERLAATLGEPTAVTRTSAAPPSRATTR